MAENKKSFVLYADYIETIEELTDEEAGKLIKHIYQYVNDMNPECKDKNVRLAFIPIKQQLKRDLANWENIKKLRSEAGKASAEAKKAKKEEEQKLTESTSVESVEIESTKSTVNVIEDVTVNVDVDEIKKSKPKTNFFVPPFLLQVIEYFKENGYTESSAIKAFNYYETGNWTDSKGTKVKNWKQKMQSVWFKDEHKVKAEDIKYGRPRAEKPTF